MKTYTSNRSSHATLNPSCGNKYQITLKDLGALSFDVVVRGDSLPASMDHPQLRQSPGSAKDCQSGESDPARIEKRGAKTAAARVLIADDTPQRAGIAGQAAACGRLRSRIGSQWPGSSGDIRYGAD